MTAKASHPANRELEHATRANTHARSPKRPLPDAEEPDVASTRRSSRARTTSWKSKSVETAESRMSPSNIAPTTSKAAARKERDPGAGSSTTGKAKVRPRASSEKALPLRPKGRALAQN